MRERYYDCCSCLHSLALVRLQGQQTNVFALSITLKKGEPRIQFRTTWMYLDLRTSEKPTVTELRLWAFEIIVTEIELHKLLKILIEAYGNLWKHVI